MVASFWCANWTNVWASVISFHFGELFPLVGFIVTNLDKTSLSGSKTHPLWYTDARRRRQEGNC
jgi:hypothetical protein